MQTFPKLNESTYIKTRRQVHSVAKFIGKFRETLVDAIAKNDNLWLSVVDKGICTPPMQEYNELEIGFNAETLIIEITNNKNKYSSISINGKTARILCDELKSILNNQFGVPVILDPGGFDSTKEINIEEMSAQNFLVQFANFASLLKDFWKSINEGVKSQICLWPDHFDNSFKWFSGRKIDDCDEQMGIGVSNGDEMYELPYVYLSHWPALRKTNTLVIPEGAYLHDAEWTGLILPYEAIMERMDIESQQTLVTGFLNESFAGIKRGFSKR